MAKKKHTFADIFDIIEYTDSHMFVPLEVWDRLVMAISTNYQNSELHVTQCISIGGIQVRPASRPGFAVAVGKYVDREAFEWT